MSTALSVQNVSKRYRIGKHKQSYNRLSESIMGFITSPLTNLAKIGRKIPEDELFWALKDVSFDVEYGESVGIIGYNGAGKSTLLKLMSRVTEMTSGKIKLNGRVGSLLEVGTGFHPELTGRENIFLNGTILGMRRNEIQRKFDEIVDFSEIEQFLDTPVKRYSSGMYIRLAFAVAAHLETEILIVDEVLAVGDAQFQQKCLKKMNKATRDGRTVIFVSHNMSSMSELCTRGILLEHGSIQIDSDIKTVISLYMNRSLDSDGVIPEDYPRLVETGEAYLRNIDLQDNNGETSRSFFMNQTITIILNYEIIKIINAATIEIGLSSTIGWKFATSFSINGGHEPYTFSPGYYEIEVDLDAKLLPGDYEVSVYMHHTDKVLTIDWVDHTVRFSIIDRAEDSYFIQKSIANPIRGYVAPMANWHPPTKIK